MKLWGGRFSKHTSALLDQYNASLPYDYRLAHFDIQGSVAHVKMLGHCGIINDHSVQTIIDGLKTVKADLNNPDHFFDIAHEDIHMHIENLLFNCVGEVAGKLHTGRSRNDQVALDMHLYLRFQLVKIVHLLTDLIEAMVSLADTHLDVIMPGYTHLQRAEPIRFSHHIMAYVQMFSRDVNRMMNLFSITNILPLGAGAMAGSGFNVDRGYVASLLNFDGLYDNSIDAVSNRDYIVEFLSNASLLMMHFSKLSEEIILWCSHEFSFIELDDQFATGSSMMPQKKNPDIPELARGKTGRVYGALFSLLTVLKGLPLAYNKDLQEDKEGLFDAIQTVTTTIDIYTELLSSMVINQSTMQSAVDRDYSNATQLANYLVGKGMHFRASHHVVGEIVKHCLERNIVLSELTLNEYHHFSKLFGADVYDFIHPESVVESRISDGGTSRQSVAKQLSTMREKIVHIKNWIFDKNKQVSLDNL